MKFLPVYFVASDRQRLALCAHHTDGNMRNRTRYFDSCKLTFCAGFCLVDYLRLSLLLLLSHFNYNSNEQEICEQELIFSEQ